MRTFERVLITEWRRLGLPTSDVSVIVGVSGGADSMSLMLGVNELKDINKLDVRLVAAHFNHGLRESESEADEEFVRQICSERSIELAVGRSAKKYSSDIEQAARIERYGFLQTTAENLKAGLVLTAHTVDDQAETFLLNLIRGSGILGLASMTPVRRLVDDDEKIRLVRPLLGWARRINTESYCSELGVEYRSDTMNEDESFTRVRIRKILLPLLKDFNPKIVERLAETARILRAEIRPGPEVFTVPLKIAELKELSDGETSRLIRAWLAVNRGNLRHLEVKHITAIQRLINSRKSGKKVELPGGDTVVKEDGRLVFGKNLVEKTGSCH